MNITSLTAGLVKANLIKNPSYLINELIFSSTHGCGVVINYTNNTDYFDVNIQMISCRTLN